MDFSQLGRFGQIFDELEVKEKKEDTKVAEKGILQGLAEAALNHYSKDAIIAGLDFVAGLSEDDLKEWTAGMSVDNTARVYRVWRACQPETDINPSI